jgi:hypothetical protein
MLCLADFRLLNKLELQIEKSGGCGVWLMLLFTMCSFLGTIFFIKLTDA